MLSTKALIWHQRRKARALLLRTLLHSSNRLDQDCDIAFPHQAISCGICLGKTANTHETFSHQQVRQIAPVALQSNRVHRACVKYSVRASQLQPSGTPGSKVSRYSCMLKDFWMFVMI